MLSAGFNCCLLIARMIVTQTIEYIFLPWNLVLAFVPYWITLWMSAHPDSIENKLKRFLFMAAWLLFIPNSFYIITDLFHFANVRTAPKWFDLLLIFSFAWNGMLCGITSLRRMEFLAGLSNGRNFSVLLVFVVMWLNALGIYIGRFLRFNSWDIITDPFSLAAEIAYLICNPVENGFAWGMTLLYGVFMSILYLSLKKLNDPFLV